LRYVTATFTESESLSEFNANVTSIFADFKVLEKKHPASWYADPEGHGVVSLHCKVTATVVVATARGRPEHQR
jgi:hypothetical protein